MSTTHTLQDYREGLASLVTDLCATDCNDGFCSSANLAALAKCNNFITSFARNPTLATAVLGDEGCVQSMSYITTMNDLVEAMQSSGLTFEELQKLSTMSTPSDQSGTPTSDT